MTDAKKAVWLLNQVSGFGPQRFRKLADRVQDLGLLLIKEFREMLVHDGLFSLEFERQFGDLLETRVFESEVEKCISGNVHIITLGDADYPKNLEGIFDPPLVLYLKGHVIPEDEASVAIVGTRHPTIYGRKTAFSFSQKLAERGLTVVSGLARGIDGEAHRGTLSASGRTIAVLGCGLDIVYPKEHSKLLEEIVESGALVSEFPLGTMPAPHNFPKRNRIISGLSLGTIVIEASNRSGSLITATSAVEEGREVFAVPGPIDSLQSIGSNQLIKEGAVPITDVHDVLNVLKMRLELISGRFRKIVEESEAVPTAILPMEKEKLQDINLSAETCQQYGKVLEFLGGRTLYLDEITTYLQTDSADVYRLLTELEMKGLIKRLFGGQFARS